jgi:hypothetical protein
MCTSTLTKPHASSRQIATPAITRITNSNVWPIAASPLPPVRDVCAGLLGRGGRGGERENRTADETKHHIANSEGKFRCASRLICREPTTTLPARPF